jgi:hypothetical protein
MRVWERGALAVKNGNPQRVVADAKETKTAATTPDPSSQSTYMDKIRATHDPAQHLKTIEDELLGTNGQALGRQGEKILRAVQQMDDEFRIYQELCATHSTTTTTTTSSTVLTHPLVTDSALRYNRHRQDALKARWELTVHRQAVGFIVNNHRYVTEQYPIAGALPVVAHGTGSISSKSEMRSVVAGDGGSGTDLQSKNADGNQQRPREKKFTDQLDWWGSVEVMRTRTRYGGPKPLFQTCTWRSSWMALSLVDCLRAYC